MSEISILSSELIPVDACQIPTDEKDPKEVVVLNKEELSPISFNTQALFRVLFDDLGIPDFYAGKNSLGLGKLIAFSIMWYIKAPFYIRQIIKCLSILHLASGRDTDGDRKFIRPCVQLEKEEVSRYNYYCTLVFSFFGFNHFVTGQPFKGVLKTLTKYLTYGCILDVGFFWSIVDIYKVTTYTFEDVEGKRVCPDYMIQSNEQNKL